jgi:hypothetical protein
MQTIERLNKRGFDRVKTEYHNIYQPYNRIIRNDTGYIIKRLMMTMQVN